MRRTALLILCCAALLVGAADAATLPMRPYSGIGVLRIPMRDAPDTFTLYDEPGLLRNGQLTASAARGLTAWLFKADDELYLLVTARKDDWLRVECDDAGRELWLQLPQRGSFAPWEQFLKGKTIVFLPHAPKKLHQLHATPGSPAATPVGPQHSMKVIAVRGDWCYVLMNPSAAGWIRWRDQDSRLLVGLATVSPESR